MKRLAALSALMLLLALTCGIGFGRVAHAAATAAPGSMVDGSVYRTGANFTVRGVINGDVYCAGGDVTVAATVHGDVLCAAQHVTLEGHVDGSAHLAGQHVEVGAVIGHGLSVAAQHFTLAPTAQVGQDASIAGGTVALQGKVLRDVAVRSTSATFSGIVGRDVRFNGGRLTIESQAMVAGNVQYWSDNTASINGSSVKGAVSHHQFATSKRVRSRLPLFLYAFAAMSLFGFVLVAISPKLLYGISERPVRSLGKTVAAGFIGMFAVPAAVVGLAITFIGLPLAFIIVLLASLIVCLSLPVTSYYVGSMVLSKSKNRYAVVALGTAAVLLACFLPAIGGLFILVSYWIGAGALYLSIGSALKRSRK